MNEFYITIGVGLERGGGAANNKLKKKYGN